MIDGDGGLVPLSAQQLLDCDTKWNRGCAGGNPAHAFDYVAHHGLAPELIYPCVTIQFHTRRRRRRRIRTRNSFDCPNIVPK